MTLPYLSKTHPLAYVARRRCRALHPTIQSSRATHLACERCWEVVIRTDAQFAQDNNLPPIEPEPFYIDEIAVERAMKGDQVRLTQAERLEAIKRMRASGCSHSAISRTLGMSGTALRLMEHILDGQGLPDHVLLPHTLAV